MSLSKPCSMPARHIVPAPAASNITALPLDALREILIRLEAKDVCRLRLVCRLWQSLLSEPYFAAVHIAWHQVPLFIACYTDDAGRDVLVDIMDISGQIIKEVRSAEGDRAVSVARDCVCVRKIDDSSSRYRLFAPIREELHYLPDRLLDPATGAVFHIPDNYAEEHVELASSLLTEPKYLFGQVPSTGEYKVFRMLFHFSIGIGGRQMFEVCTLNSTTCAGWRRAPPLEKGIQFSRFTSVVINGVLYCTCYDPHHSITFENHVTEKDLIFTFDLDTEAWGPSLRGPPISFPDHADLMFSSLGLPNVKQLTLANLNSFLAVVHGPAPYVDVWILLDYAKGLWVKMYSIQFEKYSILRPVHPLFVFWDGRIVLYKQDHDYLQIYDPGTNTLTNLMESKHFSAVAMYAGNLLSLKS